MLETAWRWGSSITARELWRWFLTGIPASFYMDAEDRAELISEVRQKFIRDVYLIAAMITSFNVVYWFTDAWLMAPIAGAAEAFSLGSPKEIPWAGSWRGRDMQRFLDIVKDSLHFLEYRPVEFIQVDDERVVVRMWELVRARSTGITHDNRHIGLATVRGGLVVEWQEYSDTAGQRSLFVEP